MKFEQSSYADGARIKTFFQHKATYTFLRVSTVLYPILETGYDLLCLVLLFLLPVLSPQLYG